MDELTDSYKIHAILHCASLQCQMDELTDNQTDVLVDSQTEELTDNVKLLFKHVGKPWLMDGRAIVSDH